MRESGVTVPIEVVPLGIDPETYDFVERPRRKLFTTLIVSTMVERKNWNTAVAAWQQAFRDNSAARLIIKSRFGHSDPSRIDDPRIRVIDENESQRGIMHWYREADVLLALGNEGFGLPVVEGMATALPVIALDAEGQADLCEDAQGLVLPVPVARRVPYASDQLGEDGHRSIPDQDVVAGHLKWVYQNRKGAGEMGRAASEWAREYRNVWRSGPQILDVIERYSPGSPTMIKAPQVWVPSWNQRCGVAEYSKYLT
jgi:glycosyltransferase involved in cell wall biosynthesis